MKNLLIAFMLVSGLTSCTKDSLDTTSQEFSSITKSEILVTVTYLSWVDSQCEPGCGGSPSQVVNAMPNAKVEIFEGAATDTDQSAHPLLQARTDDKGKALIENLEPNQYTLVVTTSIGQKSRTIYTQLNKRSSIDFSF